MAGEREEQETYDEGRLSERIMLAASAHVVGTSTEWLVGEERTTAKSYPDEAARRTRVGQSRKPLSEIIYEERYG